MVVYDTTIYDRNTVDTKRVIHGSYTIVIVTFTDVSKVSSGFDYSLLTFACRSGIAFFLVGMDAESSSASNGITFSGGHRPKMGVWARKES